MKIFIALTLFFAFTISGDAQAQSVCSTDPIPNCTRPSTAYFSKNLQIKPTAVPTTWTQVTSKESYVSLLHVSIPTGSGIVVSVRDGQGSPISLVPDIVTAVNQIYLIRWSIDTDLGYWALGGFSIKATAAGATFFTTFRQRP